MDNIIYPELKFWIEVEMVMPVRVGYYTGHDTSCKRIEY
jgi:hypothetical protein